MMNHRSVLSTLCLLLLSLSARPALADRTAEQLLADAYIRSAVNFMGYSQVLEGDAPYILAGTLLDAAVELDPKNAEAWSLRAELAETAGDQEAYEKALVGYLDTGVDDDRARYNLIRYRLARDNTLDGQLRELEELLNSEVGRALSGPLRSRLASLASNVGGELLDERARRRWAVEAARSDPSSAEAAQTMLDLVIELGGDNVRRGTATVNVVRTSPLSPGPRLELASLLADEAAFLRAAQQYQVVATRLSREPLPLESYINWAHCLAVTGQDELALQLIDEFEKALNQPAPGEAPAPAEGDAPEDQPDPAADAAEAAGDDDKPALEPVDPPLGLELIRLALLDGEEEKTAAQNVFDRIVKRLTMEQADGEEAEDEEGAEGQAKQLTLIAAAFAPDLDQAEKIVKDQQGGDIALGWIALRRGEKAKAEQLFRPHAAKSTIAACGLAMAVAQDAAGQARLLQSVVADAPSSMAALAAGRTLVKLKAQTKATATGQTLTTLMGKYPEAFWLVDVERTPWIEVRLKVTPQRLMPMDPMTAEVTVWNTSRFPINISDLGPIQDKAMIVINATNAGQQLPPSPPIIIDLGRRFSLAAGERLIFDARLDYHQFGNIRAANPASPFSFDARLIVNPVVTRAGTWLPSGIGGTSQVRDCIIQTKPTTAKDIDRWLEELASDQVTQIKKLEAVQRLAALSEELQPEIVTPAVLGRTRPALEAAWDGASPVERSWILLNTVGLESDAASYPKLLEKAKASDSKHVWLTLLSTHATEPDSPTLLAAIGRQADLPDVARFAEKQSRLLKDYAAYIEKVEAERAETPQPPAQP